MPNLSIKDVPEAIAEALRRRAAGNHRSLQGELMAIIEDAARAPTSGGVAQARTQYASDTLLAELDALVAGSSWGEAPVLTRKEANERHR